MKVEFGTPPKILSPNASNPKSRGSGTHFGMKNKAKKAYKSDCFFLTKEAIGKGWTLPDSPLIGLQITCHPRDGNQPDDDNVMAAFKNGRDGIALAFNIDDRCFRFLPVIFAAPCPEGKYVVSLYALTSDGRWSD